MSYGGKEGMGDWQGKRVRGRERRERVRESGRLVMERREGWKGEREGKERGRERREGGKEGGKEGGRGRLERVDSRRKKGKRQGRKSERKECNEKATCCSFLIAGRHWAH